MNIDCCSLIVKLLILILGIFVQHFYNILQDILCYLALQGLCYFIILVQQAYSLSFTDHRLFFVDRRSTFVLEEPSQSNTPTISYSRDTPDVFTPLCSDVRLAGGCADVAEQQQQQKCGVEATSQPRANHVLDSLDDSFTPDSLDKHLPVQVIQSIFDSISVLCFTICTNILASFLY